jgi:multiple antibiotic resistance protein
VAFYCFAICTVSALIGSWVLKLFGISIPIVQLAGGAMICRMGWLLLTSDNDLKSKKETAHPENSSGDIEDILFYPISLSAQQNEVTLQQHFFNLGALIIAISSLCLLVFICYANTGRLIHKLGPRGEQVVNRMSAFLVFCIGIQIAFSGIRALVKM